MSDLVTRIQNDVKTAMKARDEFRLGVLRMLSSKLKDAQIAQGRGEALSEAQAIQVLSSYAKQRADGAEAFAQAGRLDLRDKELRERDLVLEYLPRQLDDEAIRAVVQEIIAGAGATSLKDLSKVMGPAIARLKGQADGARVQAIVKALLGS